MICHRCYGRRVNPARPWEPCPDCIGGMDCPGCGGGLGERQPEAAAVSVPPAPAIDPWNAWRDIGGEGGGA